ncbi:uncharacterized protein Fot_14616 [Forsythia ovata]|uniref:Retrotransposon gag domain-containing protein n=1 Tax=Forsythia ovata TaxID=205694 RepID=A0ABD1W6U4_9LAMI
MDDDEEIRPLSERIRCCSVLYDFEMPKISKYACKCDPDDHILNYHASMEIAGATPVLKYKAFTLTFEGSALRRYKKLSSRSIHSWKDLKMAIRNGFVSLWLGQLPLQHFQEMRQRNDELLKFYLGLV